ERAVLAAKSYGFLDNLAKREKIYIAYADEELFKEAFAFAAKYPKKENVSVISPISGKNLTSQLKFADKIGADKTVVFAKTEFERGKIIIKDMKNKTQEEADL
ncbi:MAG: hypothetical protein LBU09_04700, partial [Endomicrobium sp.]|nr:hypothetical protein [Endomicrobium sp.]